MRRLDRPAEAYYLVELGDSGAEQGIAAVDAGTGAVRSAARLRGGGSPILVSEARARELASGDPHAKVEMVWQPCRASLSPLYPLWEVRTASGLRYVDQQGQVHGRLALPGAGG